SLEARYDGRRVEGSAIVEKDPFTKREGPRGAVVRHLPRRGESWRYPRGRRIDLDERLEDLAGRQERRRVGVPRIEPRDLGREGDAKDAAVLRPGRRRRGARAGWHLAGGAEQERERKGRCATHDA